MGRRIDEIIGKLPKERRRRITKRANEMAKEMIAYADSLRVVRQALSKTQAEIGEGLGLSQNAVSQLEGRSDLLLSTLRRYVRALGADLDIIVTMKDGSTVLLEGLGASAESAATLKESGKKKSSKRSRSSEPRSTA
jgi:transcriptional regulator with XRE-family HTH domain